MDEGEADAVWKRFTDVDRAAKRGHGIGFSSGHSDCSFHEKDSLHDRFKRAETPKNEETAAKEPLSAKDRIRSRVANAMRESKDHKKSEDSKWTHFTTQKRRELVGLQSIVDERGRMLGTEYTFTDQDHAELDSAIAAAARAPDTAKQAADDGHATAIFGGPNRGVRSPRERGDDRGSRHTAGSRERGWEYDRERGRHTERGDKHNSGRTDLHRDCRDSARYRERDGAMQVERSHRDREQRERGPRGNRSSSPDSSKRGRDRRSSGYDHSSRYASGRRGEGSHDRRHGSDRHLTNGDGATLRSSAYGRGKDDSRRLPESGRDRNIPQRSAAVPRREVASHKHQSEAGNAALEGKRGLGEADVAGGRQHAHGGAGQQHHRVGIDSDHTRNVAATESVKNSGGSCAGSGVLHEWEGLVPDGAVVVEIEAPKEKPVEQHAGLDAKFKSLAKSSWRDRLAARS